MDNGVLRFRYPGKAQMRFVEPEGLAPGGIRASSGLLLDFAPDAFLLVELGDPVGDDTSGVALRADSVVDALAAKLAALGFPLQARSKPEPPPAAPDLRATAEVAFLHGARVRYSVGGERYVVETRVYPAAAGALAVTAAHPEAGEAAAELSRARDRIARDLALPYARE